MVNAITILVMSDIHFSMQNLQRLKDFILDNKLKYDMILCPGDLGNVYHDKANISQREIDQHETQLYTMLEYIDEQLCVNDIKFYWIPGNHDVESAFRVCSDGNNQVDSMRGGHHFRNVVSVHRRVLDITPPHCKDASLYIAGLGGSTPGYKYHDFNYFEWDGYPYKFHHHPEEWMSSDLGSLLSQQQSQISHQGGHGGRNTILMTHCGPAYASTTDINRQPLYQNSRINSGSFALNQYLMDSYVQSSVCLNIHGHTHYGIGRQQIGNISVLNPGSLKDGNLMLITLQSSRDQKHSDQQWMVKEIRFLNIL
ncbi:hypothetical protein MIR68_001566 [Amoeboaphelidium protococcarum]|nr:hypothetical protein MIR68_001566 [Amoeboaphelidium protococcarum]